MNDLLKKKLNIGLTEEEVREKQEKGLVNGELDVKTKSYKKIICDNLFSLFNLVNIILFVCIIISGSLKNGLFILIVLWNFLIGVIQEIRAKKTIEKLSLISAPRAFVLRNGKHEEIQVKDILLGDIMELRNGNQICADSVVLSGSCQVNESLITGESTPILKREGDHLLSGSFLVSGKVTAEAIHIGSDNYVNKITLGAKYFKKPDSIIMKSVKTIVWVVAICLIPIGAMLVWNNFFRVEQTLPQAIVRTVAAVSAMIPGGLVLLVSIVLAVSVVRLSMHKTLVQDLYCVENLARVDVLCLDKTGTITEGSMKVEKIVELQSKSSIKDLAHFVFTIDDENSTLNSIREYLKSFQNQSDMTKTENQAEAASRSTTESAEFTIPFSSDRKWSLVYENGTSYIMGAPEFILNQVPEELKKIIKEFTEKSRRVLLFAEAKERPQHQDSSFKLPKEIEPQALIIIGDRVRKEAKETFAFFKEEGVTIKVISGDNPETVSRVAMEAGLTGAERFIDASCLQSYEEILKIVDEYTVFGRVTPTQKLDIMKALKAKGHITAMTGDGANDVLALKEADCSIAMQNGSDAARNVANMVLLDSNFASLPKVVAEGRKSINNLQRSASLYLTKTIYAFIMAIVFILVTKIPYVFENIQVTLIGAITIGIPSFFLALEPNKQRIRKHFLLNVFQTAIPSGVLMAAAIISEAFIAKISLGATDVQISSACTFTALATGIIIIFDICGKLNKWKGILLGTLILAAFLARIILPGIFSFVSIPNSIIMSVIIIVAIFFIIHFILIRIVKPKINKKNE